MRNPKVAVEEIVSRQTMYLYGWKKCVYLLTKVQTKYIKEKPLSELKDRNFSSSIQIIWGQLAMWQILTFFDLSN